MGAVLSEDLGKRLVAAVEAGASQRQAANRFAVSVSSPKLWCDTGGNTALSPPGRKGLSDARTEARHRPISS
jgi:transposase